MHSIKRKKSNVFLFIYLKLIDGFKKNSIRKSSSNRATYVPSMAIGEKQIVFKYIISLREKDLIVKPANFVSSKRQSSICFMINK